MEVISGAGSCSTTPTSRDNRSLIPSSPGGSERMPSQDTMDRSIHNNSSHGKSPSQIIKELRASNAFLTQRSASAEAEFMNDISKITKDFESDEATLKESLGKKETQISSMESRCSSTEARIREKDTQMSKLKEETSFQRHSIADLKNQLYQLQTDIEEAEYDKNDGNEKWSTEKELMERDISRLKKQVDQQKRGNEYSKNSDGEINDSEVMQTWKQLEETQEALEDSSKRLHETQSTLATFEQDQKRVVKEHEETLLTLKTKFKNNESDWGRKERDLQNRLDDLEKDDIQLTKDLRVQIEDRDATISSLRDEVSNYASQAAELTIEVATVKVDKGTQDKYRTDEIGDLRLLNDAQEAEIRSLKKNTDDFEEELRKIQESRNGENDSRVSVLESQLQESLEAYQSVERKSSINASAAIKDKKLISRLEEECKIMKTDLDEEREIARKALDKQKQKSSAGQKEDESRSAQSLREVMVNAAKERAELKSNFGAKVDEQHDEIFALQKQLKEGAADENHHIELLEAKNDVRELEQQVRMIGAKRASSSKVTKQLREAQLALVALDDEKANEAEKFRNQIATMEKGMEEMESNFEKILINKGGGKSRAEITNLMSLLKEREATLQETRASLTEARGARSLSNSVSNTQSKGFPLDELEAIKHAKEKVERELKVKMEDRDTTISALVKSSVIQEEKTKSLMNEVQTLRARHISDGGDELMNQDQGEIEILRISIEDYKIAEDSLKREVSKLQNNMLKANEEKKQLEEELHDNDVGGITNAKISTRSTGVQILCLKREKRKLLADHSDNLQERDDAIATLVQQSIAQEAEIKSLKFKIFKAGKNTDPVLDKDQSRLQNESEIFAAQIIEQDEEMEALKGNLEGRESEVASLNRELKALKNNGNAINGNRMRDLQAELDEIEEANETQRDELRDLRRQVREAKSSADDVDDIKLELQQAVYALDEYKNKVGTSVREDQFLKEDLEDAVTSKNVLEQKLTLQLDSMRRLKTHALQDLENQLEERDATIADIKVKLSNHETKIASLQSEVKSLGVNLEEKTGIAEDAQISLKEVRKMLDEKISPEEVFQEKKALKQVVETLKEELAMLEEDKSHIDEMKMSLTNAEEERKAWQHGIIDSHDRKISLLQLNKDITIDSLRKELTEIKGGESDNRQELMITIEHLEMKNKDIKDDLEAKLDLKSTKIFALEHTLSAQEQQVENMRSEMDQLQSTMEQANLTRRAEIEEMQQEMMDSSSRVNKHDREVVALKMKLEETEYLRKSETAKFKEKIASIESGSVPAKASQSLTPLADDPRLVQVRDRLEKLQWRNTSLQDENITLRNRLEQAETDSKASKSDKQKSAVLEQEVIFLMRKVKELEMEARCVPTSRQSRPPQPERKSRRTSSSPKRTTASPRRFLRKKSSSKSESPEPRTVTPTGKPTSESGTVPSSGDSTYSKFTF